MFWKIMADDAHVCISGPGGLEIILRDFDPDLAVRDALPPDALGSLLQRQWRYPLDDGVWLKGVSTGDAARPELHHLHLGMWVLWTIPEHLAEALHTLMAGNALSPEAWLYGTSQDPHGVSAMPS